ncbi:TPA: hypothetical protein DIV55_00570 [Patescibacteria group bacterium]|uniref:Uncharacterized protein n=1 Tax=Candidatus Gottesmanbacteria bacterium GW2011_GWA1_43_11 TaxID=1618436 RepID=A0A0G1CDD6_9BACT|nr:MAG: hypothetical protein UV59_C0036G0007 [Candidatus Gottesmanbacteria bacterium GW2011_GWA1_43_11]HCS78217.1 hypothetical protein [Patescibacteria group bacterium]
MESITNIDTQQNELEPSPRKLKILLYVENEVMRGTYKDYLRHNPSVGRIIEAGGITSFIAEVELITDKSGVDVIVTEFNPYAQELGGQAKFWTALRKVRAQEDKLAETKIRPLVDKKNEIPVIVIAEDQAYFNKLAKDKLGINEKPKNMIVLQKTNQLELAGKQTDGILGRIVRGEITSAR